MCSSINLPLFILHYSLFIFHCDCLQSHIWRRHPDLNRGSEFCRLVPYHLAIAPLKQKYGAGSGNRTRESTLARLHFTTKLYLHKCFIYKSIIIIANFKEKVKVLGLKILVNNLESLFS